MRDMNRIDIVCDKLKEIWRQEPDWRFMQLINNFCREYLNSDGFYVEDEDLVKKLEDYMYLLHNKSTEEGN